MNRADVIELFIEIKQEYRGFDDSDEAIDRHLKYLKDFPFDAAMRNVEEYIKTNSRYPPGIADIRGHLGDQLDSERSKVATRFYFEQLDRALQNDEPPPDGFWDDVRAKLRGEQV